MRKFHWRTSRDIRYQSGIMQRNRVQTSPLLFLLRGAIHPAHVYWKSNNGPNATGLHATRRFLNRQVEYVYADVWVWTYTNSRWSFVARSARRIAYHSFGILQGTFSRLELSRDYGIRVSIKRHDIPFHLQFTDLHFYNVKIVRNERSVCCEMWIKSNIFSSKESYLSDLFSTSKTHEGKNRNYQQLLNNFIMELPSIAELRRREREKGWTKFLLVVTWAPP